LLLRSYFVTVFFFSSRRRHTRWSLDLIVYPPGDGFARRIARRRRDRESSGRRRKQISCANFVLGRNGVESSDSRHLRRAVHTTGILQRGGKSCWSVCIERIDNGKTCSVVNLAKARPNHGLVASSK